MRMFKTALESVVLVLILLGTGSAFVPVNPPVTSEVQIVPVFAKQLHWRELAQIQEEKHGLYPGLLEGTCDWETQASKNRSTARSYKGALGVCQVMPATAAWLAGIHPEDPQWKSALRVFETILQDDQINMHYAGLYMKVCYKGESVKRALWCYNNGHNSRWKGGNRYTRMVGAKVHTINHSRGLG